jgi:uroporphyrin-III C-methyltransferase / precorrin-2 dehydrogenase / sirohydrochlorin ferrochelatase
MDYFPIFINLKDKKCLVVGGGSVAVRKIESLLSAHAQVTVIAESVLPQLARDFPGLHLINRRFEENDITYEYALVVAATDDRAVNDSVFRAAEKAGVLCNVVDQPELCSFILPSVFERGKIIAAVSTSGASPYLAADLKNRIATMIGDEYTLLSEFLADVRDMIKGRLSNPDERKKFWERFFAEDPALIARREGKPGLEKRLNGILDILSGKQA